MDTTRECGCKGRRTCLWCENIYKLSPDFLVTDEMRERGYVYCDQCQRAWQGWDVSILNAHPYHVGESMEYSGVLVVPEFLNYEEASSLLQGIDLEPWDASQSGRRKQNYGPKCNFKKKKLSKGDFYGFPKFSTFVQEKFKLVPFLDEFFVIEQCSLEYDPTKGASIDPHIDDCWIWGERIVTVNVIGDSVLTMVPYKGPNDRYNLNLAPPTQPLHASEDRLVRIFMPARSLIVLYGQARYRWEHAVLREDTRSRRVCLAYREFTTPYLPGGNKEEEGREILNISKFANKDSLNAISSLIDSIS